MLQPCFSLLHINQGRPIPSSPLPIGIIHSSSNRSSNRFLLHTCPARQHCHTPLLSAMLPSGQYGLPRPTRIQPHDSPANPCHLGRMNCVSGGSFSSIASIQPSSCSVWPVPNATRFFFASVESSAGVATAEPTSNRRD